MSLAVPAAEPARRALQPALPVAKIFHWASATLILCMFVSGVLMTQLAGGPVADWLYTAHKSTGAVLLCLLTIRLVYRLAAIGRRRWPEPGAGHLVHWALYALGIIIPLVGWAAVSDFGARKLFFGLSLPEIIAKGTGYADLLFQAHAYLAFTLIALVVVHIGFALNDYITRGQARHS
jgi:cytochrome b561